ncbi:MAG: ATP-binding protein [Butyrivibrio sp.]|nr:ATP-binding protein [Butyrivibrio sp.]
MEAFSEEQLFLIDHSSCIIYVIDADTYELLYANAEALSVWDEKEYQGRTCYEFINSRKNPCPWCSVPIMKNGNCHVEAAYSPQQDVWFTIDCIEMKWAGRKAIAVYARDITKQQKQREKLELDIRNIDGILGNIPGGVAVFSDRNGKIHLEYTNDGFYEIHFGSRCFWNSQSEDPVNWIQKEDRRFFEEAFQRVKSGEVEKGSATYRVLGEDGKVHWVNQQFCRAYVVDGIQNYYSSFTCLDEQMQKENARIETRRIYESAVEEARLFVWEYDIKMHRVTMAENEFSKYDYRKFGLPKVVENAPGSLIPYIDERYVDVFLEMYRKVENGEPEASCDIWYKFGVGTEPRCEHIAYTTIYDENGRPVKAYGIGQNITAQMVERENYQRLYQQVSSTFPDTVSSSQLNLTKNRYIKGYSIFPQVLKRLETVTADEHFRAAAAAVTVCRLQTELLATFNCAHLLEMFKSGKSEFSKEYPVRASGGGIVWVNTVVHLLQNPDTGDVEALTCTTDVSRRKKDEEIIARFAENGCDFIGIIDPAEAVFEMHYGVWDCKECQQGQKVEFEGIRHLLSETYVTGENVEDFLKETMLSEILKSLQQNAQYTVTYDYREPGNDEPCMKKQLRFLWMNTEQDEILVIQNDITDVYRTEQKKMRQMQEAVLEAEKASSSKSEFVSRISHDIRTPISIISSMTQFAFEDMENHEKLRSDLRKIEASNTFLLSLINDVLDISKIDSGKIELHLMPYIYADYISNIRNMFEPLCAQKSIQFEILREPEKNVILVDPTRLNQITLNLLSNAVKYTPPGGKIVFSAGTQMQEDGRVTCEIRVKDTGIGMSHEFQQKMFEPFTQEYDNPKRDKGSTGTGLGLSIVKKLVDLMKGTITVQSELGKGTEFVLRFSTEIATAAKNDGSGRDAEEQEAEKKLEGVVLLAEDNPINTEIARRILESIGVSVVHGENGKEILELFEDAAPDTFVAILMDIQMPVMNGYEATEAIRGLHRADASEIPIIAMTADAFSAALEHSREIGMNDYITKPIDPQQLRQTLEKYIKKSSRIG